MTDKYRTKQIPDSLEERARLITELDGSYVIVRVDGVEDSYMRGGIVKCDGTHADSFVLQGKNHETIRFENLIGDVILKVILR